MPCGDGGVPYPPTREEELNAKVPMRALCALLAVLPGPAFAAAMNKIDWLEAGITHDEFMEWYRLHKRRDEQRKKLEKEAKDHAALVKKARSKLTAKERKVLGIK